MGVSDTDAMADEIQHRLPPLKTRLTNLSLYVFGCTNMLIIVPSSARYAESMGAPASFSGIVIAAYSLSQLFMAYPYYYLMKALSIKSLMSLMAVLSISANVLYACAGVTGSIYVVIVARMLLGISIFPAPYMYYITRAVGLQQRSRYFLQVSACMAAGNVLGPLLASLIDVASHNLRQSAILNSSTLPGWLMALCFLFYLCLLRFCFEEPPPEPAQEASELEEGTAKGEEATPLVWAGMVVLLYLTVFVNTLGSSWEVFTVLLAERSWGCSEEHAALYLAAASAFMVPVSLYGSSFLAGKFSDRAMLLPCFAVAAAATSLFFDFGLKVSGEVCLYSAASLVFLTSMQLGRGFVQSLSTKVIPASHKACFSTILTLASRSGETVGPLIASFMGQSSYATLAVTCSGLALISILAFFPQLETHKRAT